MNRYIDAEKLIAEINNRLMSVNLEELGNFGSHRVWAYNDVKDLIDSLQQEQPEVDLEKELVDLEDEIDTVFFKNYPGTEKLTHKELSKIAHHFYELGKKARKED